MAFIALVVNTVAVAVLDFHQFPYKYRLLYSLLHIINNNGEHILNYIYGIIIFYNKYKINNLT
ncbi:hypothetical protein AN2V17_02130 [Vallitalea sp. AN17-2]|uniref:Uncharacterized protein n=1 Tax=Vallitalea maricola TaxID=3074433 RepID=A0ACB5UEF6_9FIRM|nr:hypothetical protein AN2V17_02130 [Vallitalea sp. AN17-2]